MDETDQNLSKCLVDDDRLHERRLRTMQAAYCRSETFEDIAKDYAVTVHAIRNDWERRGSWLPQFLRLDDVCALQADIVGKWIAYLDACIDMAQKYRLDNKHAANEAMKNYREGLDRYASLLQSMGTLPKAVLEQSITVKKEASDKEYDFTEEEKRILSEASKLLFQKEVERAQKERSGGLH